MKNAVEEVIENVDTEKITEAGKAVEESDKEPSNKDRYIFQYILSFIVPFIAFILGTLLLTKDEKKDRLRGKICLLTGAFSICVFIIISRL